MVPPPRNEYCRLRGEKKPQTAKRDEVRRCGGRGGPRGLRLLASATNAATAVYGT